MPKKKRFPAVVAIIIILLIVSAAAYFAIKALQGSGRLTGRESSASDDSSGNRHGSGDATDGAEGNSENNGGPDAQGELVVGPDEQTMPVWVPFAIDNTPAYPLDEFRYEGRPVEAASVRDAAASGDNEGRVTGQVKEKAPHYTFEQLPLLKPDNLVLGSEQTVDEDIAFSIDYYTKATVDEALAFYRDKLGSYDRFQEDNFDDASTGEYYMMSFSTVVDGGYQMDGSVMIAEMPETTGYTCAIMETGTIRGIAKKEVAPVGIRDDGLPDNFPDNLVTAYEADEIYEAEGDSEGCWVQFSSRATYLSAVKHYRNALGDKAGFSESNDVEGEVYFYCTPAGWEIDVRVMDNGDGHAYIEINCYVQ